MASLQSFAVADGPCQSVHMAAKQNILLLRVLTLASLHCLIAFATPVTVPAVRSWTADGEIFTLPVHLSVLVDAKFQDWRDESGLTLIPPTLHEFATTFTSDLKESLPSLSPQLRLAETPSKGSIFLTIDQNAGYTLANGRPSSEGYMLDVSQQGIEVRGSSPLGVWRGLTTLLQGLVQGNATFPTGTIVDQPDWATRGIMLDCGRQWYPANYLKEMCAYLSYFKASEFHLHLSDNLPGRVVGPLNSTYARFRLHSDKLEFAGLSPHVNETYSREEFDDLQRSCASRGVTIVPEIEAPGHALVISQWKPQLALSTDPTLLTLSIPESTQAMKDIWTEFLPWIHSKQVSIGADEYSSALADDYLRFVGNMSEFIQQVSGKTIRSWGTNEPSRNLVLTKNTTIQHWEGSEDNALQLLQQGYQVINSDDFFLYIVLKESGSFPQKLNQTRLWRGNALGGPWDPTQFDHTSPAGNPSLDSPTLLGGIMAAWSDQGPTATTPLEAFYSFKRGLPVVAANAWHAPTRSTALTQEQFDSVFDVLEASAPGQNLDRRIKSKGVEVVVYDFAVKNGGPTIIVKDTSGNGYNAVLEGRVTESGGGLMLENGSRVSIPLGSKGANYTSLLSYSITVPIQAPTATLLSGPDNSLILSRAANGSTTFAFVSSNITYPLTGFALPTGTHSTDLAIQGTEDSTTVFVNGTRVGDFRVTIRNSAISSPMSFVAPVRIQLNHATHPPLKVE
ncbi:glycosyl hydrolase 20 family protein [Pleurotus pulmonarius]